MPDLNCCYDTSWIVSQGAYSHSLAEWALTACSWFAKDLPRLKRQQKDKNWEPYYVEELRLVTVFCCSKLRSPVLSRLSHLCICLACTYVCPASLCGCILVLAEST